MAAYIVCKYYRTWNEDQFRGIDCVFTNRKRASSYATAKTKKARELFYIVKSVPLNPKTEEKDMKDGVCGNCGSGNVHYLYFDADDRNKGFQEFECKDCGASTYQTFEFTITDQEVTLKEDKE